MSEVNSPDPAGAEKSFEEQVKEVVERYDRPYKAMEETSR